MKRRGSSRKRPGVFSASAFSQPGFVDEAPVSFEKAMDRLAQDASHPGEAILIRMDEINAAASAVYRESEGEPMPQPARWQLGAVTDPDLDTPYGFALRVASMSGSIRSRVMNLSEKDDRVALELVRDALDLAAGFYALQMEFINGPVTVTGRGVQNGAKLGGENEARLRKGRQEHLRWRMEADRIRSEAPDLNKMEVARRVKNRLSLDVSLRTICRRTQKVGQLPAS